MYFWAGWGLETPDAVRNLGPASPPKIEGRAAPSLPGLSPRVRPISPRHKRGEIGLCGVRGGK